MYFPGYCRKILLITGSLIILKILYTFFFENRIGPISLLAGISSVLLLVCTYRDKQSILSPKLLLLITISYLSLLGLECILLKSDISIINNGKAYKRQTQGMYTADDILGYKLTPGWKGSFMTKLNTGSISINTVGHRDDELERSNKKLVLLLGDSFTFGYLLDQSETFDKQIEKLNPSVNAYNMGVPGYGIPQVVNTLDKCDLQANTVIYFFNNSDLDFGVRQRTTLTAINGVLSKKPEKDHDEEKTYSLIQKSISDKSFILGTELLTLSTFRKEFNLQCMRLYDYNRYAEMHRLQSPWPENYNHKNILSAVEQCIKLREICTERNFVFHIVIIPTLGEISTGKYSNASKQYIEMITLENFSFSEYMDRLSTDDYIPHDGHFNKNGTKITAEVISEFLN